MGNEDMKCSLCGQELRCGCTEKDYMIEKIEKHLPLKEYKPEWEEDKAGK